MAIDVSGQAYVAGSTASSNFPTTAGAFDTTFNGGSEDAFALRLDPTGSALTYSTFLGGSAADHGVGMATDSLGRSYLTGYTASANFPVTASSFDATYNGGSDAFITRLDSTGNRLEYSAFLGGGSGERSFAVVADNDGRASIVGSTGSSNFPVTSNAFDTGFNGGANDGFFARVSANGDAVENATFLGGPGNDEIYAVALSGQNDLLVTGFTSDAGFPTTLGAFDTGYNGRDDAFVARLAPPTSTPMPSPTQTRTPTPTLTPVPTLTWTPTSTWTPTQSPTHTWTPTPSPSRAAGRLNFLPLLTHDATLTPTPTPTPVPGDPYEPNNSFLEAWGPLTSEQVYRALIYALGDSDDYYWFDVAQAHAIQISLEHIPAGNNYHLYLYTSSLALAGYSGNPDNQSEYISTTSSPVGHYFVRVQRVTGYSATQQYVLRATFR